MAVNSKTKGDTYERKIAKKLTEWTGLKFERVPASGGLKWAEDNRVYGDIVTNDPDFPITIECKNREEWNMDSLINGSKKVAAWWNQVTDDTAVTGNAPMVIFTRNLQPDYVMIRAESFEEGLLELKSYLEFMMEVVVSGEHVMIFKLDELIEKADIKR